MKRNYKLDIKKVLIYCGVAVVFFLGACMYLRSVTIPDHGTANQVSTFTMHCFLHPVITGTGTEVDQLVVGFLAPKSWNASQNSQVTYTSPRGNGTMSVMQTGIKEKTTSLDWADAAKQTLGNGGNLVDDVEWIIFLADNPITAVNQDTFAYDVAINVKLGPENMLVKLGFFNAILQYGFSPPFGTNPYYATYFSDCFSVTGGEGNIVDFCNPQLSAVSPRSSLDNDLITLTYDNGLLSTALSNENSIYLCGTAYATDGTSYSVCEQTSKTMLNPLGGKKYRIDLWPRGFFNVGSDKTLDRIEYYYTDATGTSKVGYANTSSPFIYSFICKN